MCRFSASLAPPQPEDREADLGLEALLEDDGFSWFNAIECLPDNELEELDGAQCQTSSADGSASNASPNDASASGYSDTSSYDLVELFKQQVQEQQQPAGYAMFAPQPAVQEQLARQPGFAMPDAKPLGFPAPTMLPAAAAFASAPMNACPPAAVVPPAAPSSFTGMPPAGLNMAPKMPLAPSAGSIVRKPGSKSQRTQAEVDAAVERIKQKRRSVPAAAAVRSGQGMPGFDNCLRVFLCVVFLPQQQAHAASRAMCSVACCVRCVDMAYAHPQSQDALRFSAASAVQGAM